MPESGSILKVKNKKAEWVAFCVASELVDFGDDKIKRPLSFKLKDNGKSPLIHGLWATRFYKFECSLRE